MTARYRPPDHQTSGLARRRDADRALLPAPPVPAATRRDGRRRRWLAGDGERGSAAIELAILFPVFLVLILLGVQSALIFYGRTVALAAAQRGAAAESAYQAPPGAGQARAGAYLTRMGDVLSDWKVIVTRVREPGAAEPTAVRITVTGTTLGWLGLRFRISQTAYAPLERFTTEEQP